MRKNIKIWIRKCDLMIGSNRINTKEFSNRINTKEWSNRININEWSNRINTKEIV